MAPKEFFEKLALFWHFLKAKSGTILAFFGTHLAPRPNLIWQHWSRARDRIRRLGRRSERTPAIRAAESGDRRPRPAIADQRQRSETRPETRRRPRPIGALRGRRQSEPKAGDQGLPAIVACRGSGLGQSPRPPAIVAE